MCCSVIVLLSPLYQTLSVVILDVMCCAALRLRRVSCVALRCVALRVRVRVRAACCVMRDACVSSHLHINTIL